MTKKNVTTCVNNMYVITNSNRLDFINLVRFFTKKNKVLELGVAVGTTMLLL